MYKALWLTMLSGLAVVICLAAYIIVTAPPDPELRNENYRLQGYTGCAKFQDYVNAQVNDPSVECIEGGELIEFRDSSYYTGVCPDPNWC